MNKESLDYENELRKAKGLTPEVPREELRNRLKKVKELMGENGFKAILIYGSPFECQWVRYLANYIHPFVVGDSFLLIPLDGNPILLIDRPWYLENAKEMSWIKDIRIFPFKFQFAVEEWIKIFTGIFSELKLKGDKIGICELGMPTVFYKVLQQALPSATFEDIGDLLDALRGSPSPYDIQIVRQAAEIADEGMRVALAACREGVTEYEVGLEAEKVMVALGAEVGTGNSSFGPHIYVASSSTILSNVRPYHYTGRKLRKGDMFFIDLGICYKGSYIDFCRTVVIGKPSEKQKEIFELTMKTHEALFRALKPGVSGSELYQIGYKIAAEKGYEDAINNVWLGHETGYITMGGPVFFVKDERHVIREGTFVNIEPGIFVPEIGLASVEDCTFITSEGAEFVTKCERQLHIA